MLIGGCVCIEMFKTNASDLIKLVTSAIAVILMFVLEVMLTFAYVKAFEHIKALIQGKELSRATVWTLESIKWILILVFIP